MNAKEFMGRYLKLVRRSEELKAEREALLDQSITVDPTSEHVQASGLSDRVGNLATRLADKEIELLKKELDAAEARLEILNVVSQVAMIDDRYAIVLRLRYIKGYTYDRVAEESGLFICSKTAMRYCEAGLKLIDETMDIVL